MKKLQKGNSLLMVFAILAVIAVVFVGDDVIKSLSNSFAKSDMTQGLSFKMGGGKGGGGGSGSPKEEPGPTEPSVTSTPSPRGSNTPTPSPSRTPSPRPTSTPSPRPSVTSSPMAGNPLNCPVPNIAWSSAGRLLRGGAPGNAVSCLSAAGVDVLIDQRVAGSDNEASLASQAGLEYINLGIADDTAPSPARLRAWIDTVNNRLSQGKVVLIHDTAGRGRMGFWDAVYFMRSGVSAQSSIEGRYLAKDLPFQGAKIGCNDGGNGQVQALAEISQILTGMSYIPTLDEYGTRWLNCPRPSYMNGWNYGSVLP